MVPRWTAGGTLNTERSFRPIKGSKQMPQLVEALHRHAHPESAPKTETVGAAAESSNRVATHIPRHLGHPHLPLGGRYPSCRSSTRNTRRLDHHLVGQSILMK